MFLLILYKLLTGLTPLEKLLHEISLIDKIYINKVFYMYMHSLTYSLISCLCWSCCHDNPCVATTTPVLPWQPSLLPWHWPLCSSPWPLPWRTSLWWWTVLFACPHRPPSWSQSCSQTWSAESQNYEVYIKCLGLVRSKKEIIAIQ